MLAQDTHAPKTVHGAQWEKKGQQHQFGRTGFHVFFFCFGTCAIIKHKGKLIPQAKQLPVKIDRVPFKYWINDDYWRSTPPNFHKPWFIHP